MIFVFDLFNFYAMEIKQSSKYIFNVTFFFFLPVSICSLCDPNFTVMLNLGGYNNGEKKHPNNSLLYSTRRL